VKSSRNGIGADIENSCSFSMLNQILTPLGIPFMSQNKSILVLTHECRAESINPDSIFKGNNYEVQLVTSWLGNYFIRYGSYLFSQTRKQRYAYTDTKVNVVEKTRSVMVLSYEEVLRQFRDGEYQRLFMEVTYEYADEKYTIIAPARYVNFPNKNKTDKFYLQPISGYILFYDGSKFCTAYVASHIDGSETEKVEIICRAETSYFDQKPHTKRLQKIRRPIRKFFSKYLKIDEFYKVYRLNGKVKFFIYKK